MDEGQQLTFGETVTAGSLGRESLINYIHNSCIINEKAGEQKVLSSQLVKVCIVTLRGIRRTDKSD